MKSYKEKVVDLLAIQVLSVAVFVTCMVALGIVWFVMPHRSSPVFSVLVIALPCVVFAVTALINTCDVRRELLESTKVLEDAWKRINASSKPLGGVEEFKSVMKEVTERLALMQVLERYELLRDIPPVEDMDRWTTYKNEDDRRHDALAILRKFWQEIGNETEEFTVHGAECAINDALRERIGLKCAETGTALAMSDALDLLLRYLADIGGVCFLTKPREVTAGWLQNMRWGALMRALAIADFMERGLKKTGRDEQIRARVPQGALEDIVGMMNTGRRTCASAKALHYGHRASNGARWPAEMNAWLASFGPSPEVNPGEELQFLAEWVFQPQTEDGWWKAAMPFSGLAGDGDAFDEWRKAQTATGLFWNPRNPRVSR